MTVTPFTAARQRQQRLQLKPARQLLALCGSKWAHCGIDTTQRSSASASTSATEWHSYGMQQKMRPYPQPGCMQHKGLRQLCNLQLGQQHHHHYITSPRQISALLFSVCECVCVPQSARARECHICLAELEQMCARGLPLTSCPSARPGQARPRPAPSVPPPCACACARTAVALLTWPSPHLLLLCALSHYNGSQLPFTASNAERAARPVRCHSPLMWLLPAPPAASQLSLSQRPRPAAACRIISHFPGAPPAPLLSPFVVVLVLILLASCLMPHSTAAATKSESHIYADIYGYICLLYLCIRVARCALFSRLTSNGPHSSHAPTGRLQSEDLSIFNHRHRQLQLEESIGSIAVFKRDRNGAHSTMATSMAGGPNDKRADTLYNTIQT